MGEVPFGYKMHNGVAVPDYAVARTVPAEVVLDKLGVSGRFYEANGKNGKELQGWCPFGGEHGKHGSFSINKESGAFMCHACKRHGSHVLRFVEVYLETHADQVSFVDGKGTQAAARWLISLAGSDNKEVQESEIEDTPALLSDFDKGLWCGFMAAIQPQLKVLLMHAKNPAMIAELFSETVEELARKIEK
jgi:hypothetical protein